MSLKKFKVTVTETTEHELTVEASSEEEARELAEEEHAAGESRFIGCTDREFTATEVATATNSAPLPTQAPISPTKARA